MFTTLSATKLSKTNAKFLQFYYVKEKDSVRSHVLLSALSLPRERTLTYQNTLYSEILNTAPVLFSGVSPVS